MIPKAKQYLYQDQDEVHYFRVSLALAVTGNHILPKSSAFGTSAHDALDFRSSGNAATSGAAGNSSGRRGGAGAKGGGKGRAATTALLTSPATPSFAPDSGPASETYLWSLYPLVGGAEQDALQKSVGIAGAMWALHEDKLVVRCEEARVDVVAVYAAYHRANPLLYPKTSTDPSFFKQRYNDIGEDPMRQRLVALMPEDTVTQLDQTAIDELTKRWGAFFASSASSASPSSKASASLSNQAKATALKAIQRCQQQKSSGGHRAYRREDIVIHAEVRQGVEQANILCCSEDITPQSPLLRDLFNRSTDYQPGGAKKIVLSERDGMWASIPDMYSVFAADNLNRFKQFCEAPSLLATLVEMGERLKRKEDEATAEWDAFVEQTFQQRDEKLQLVEDLRTDAIRLMRSRYEIALKRDMAALQELYQSHMFHEEATMQQFFQQQRNNLETFFDREIASMGVLRDLTDTSEPEENLSRLKAEVQALSEMCADTYGSRTLPRLLMLSDVLLATELRSQCLKLIALDFSKYAHMPEMNSQLLRANTLRELMTLVPDGELLRASRGGRGGGAPGGSSLMEAAASFRRRPSTAASSPRMSDGQPASPSGASLLGGGSAAPPHKGIPLEVIDAELAERSRARAAELDMKTMDDMQDLCRRVNALIVRIKQEQASAVVGGGGNTQSSNPFSGSDSPPQSPRARQPSLVPMSSNPGAASLRSASMRQALASVRGVKAQPKTAEELRKGEQEETFYLCWRDLLQDALARKLHVVGGAYNVAVLRVPKGMEGHCALLHHRRGCDAKTSFKYITVEGQGSVVIGESSQLLYWEARLIFVDTGTRYPATLSIGMDAVPNSLNGVQLAKLQRLLEEEQSDSAHAKAMTSEKMAKEKKEANPAIGPTSSSTATSIPPHVWIHNMMPLATTNTSYFSGERIAGVTPMDVSALPQQPKLLHGISWGSEGVLHIDGVPFDLKQPYDVGDRIGIAIHTLTGDVKLYKNEQEIVLDPRTTPVPRLRRGVAYIPAVTMYCTSLVMPNRNPATNVTGSAFLASAASGAGGSLQHQMVNHEDDTVALSQLAGALIPKARLMVDMDGRSSRGLPSGCSPYSKGAVPVSSITRTSSNP